MYTVHNKFIILSDNPTILHYIIISFIYALYYKYTNKYLILKIIVHNYEILCTNTCSINVFIININIYLYNNVNYFFE